jgi:predicted aspartyl protease
MPFKFSFEVRKGPIVNVTIEALAEEPSALHTPVRAKALIDTGADATIIRPRIAQELRLGSHETEALRLALQKQEREGSVHFVNLTIATLPTFPNLRVVAGEWTGPEEVLIGRDILDELIMLYDGPAGEISLTRRARKRR